MAAKSQEALNATGMSLAIYCGGMAYVGVRLAGTWVGTVSFYGSENGLSFVPIYMTPFASGTAVASSTSNGNWFIPAANYVVVKAVFTRTSGTAQVYLAASTDQSYQDAFLTPSVLYATSSATNALNTLTQTAQTNRAWNLKTLEVTVNGTPSWLTSPNYQILDGSTVIWQGDLELVGSSGYRYSITLPEGGLVGTPGADLVVKVAAAGSGRTTNINAQFSAA